MITDILRAAIVLLLCAAAAVPAAGATAVVLVEPADTTVCTLVAFPVRICAGDPVANLMGWDLRVAYDGNVLSVVDVTEGSLPAGCGHPTFFRQLDDEGGATIVHVNGSILGKTVDGPGALVTIWFSPVAPGISPVLIIEADLRDGENTPLDPAVIHGSVTVDAAIGLAEASWGEIKRLTR